jgi:hypothetical protein
VLDKIIFLIFLITLPTTFADLSVSGSAHGTGLVSSNVATSDGHVQVDENINDTRWAFDLNNTSLVMGDRTYELLENGTIVLRG